MHLEVEVRRALHTMQDNQRLFSLQESHTLYPNPSCRFLCVELAHHNVARRSQFHRVGVCASRPGAGLGGTPRQEPAKFL
jgi:hypothetical protein